MSMVLCHATALKIYNAMRVCINTRASKDPSARLRPIRLPKSRMDRDKIPRGVPSKSEVGALLGDGLLVPDSIGYAGDSSRCAESPRLLRLSAPVHVLVDRHADRTARDNRIAHRAGGELPPKSLVRLAPNLQIVSPEYLFMQMARGMDELELVWLCCEFLATYALVETEECLALQPAYQLTTKFQLAAYLKAAREMNVQGAAKGLRALEHAVEGAASPPESELGLLMTLPCAKGGRAIPQPLLNYRIDADRRTVATYGEKYYVVDAVWPEKKLIVEYDGDACHLDSMRRAKDNDRTAALEQMGYRVIHISTGQLKSLSFMDDALKRVANHLGRHTRDGAHGYDWQARRSELYLKLHRLSTQGIDWSNC